jgi:DNA-binding NtrC family response regulator
MVSEKHGVLIVDDDENICRSLSVILRKEGYETEAVPTGREALQRARERFFDAVLLDVKLTDMEGVDLISPLKEAHPATAIIVISAYDEPDTVRQALAEGASTYLPKPFAMKDVWDTVSKAISEQRRQLQKETG